MQIKNKDPDFSHPAFREDVSSVCLDFIRQLLEKDPAKRLSVKTALKHEFFHNKEMRQNKKMGALSQAEKQDKFLDYVSNPHFAALKNAN